MLTVKPTDSTLGAYVTGVDLKQEFADSVWQATESAFHEHAVLVFPAQHLDDSQQVAFSERFGALERLITQKTHDQTIVPIVNVDSKKRILPEGSKYDLMLKGNTYWHTDSSFKSVPSKAPCCRRENLPVAEAKRNGPTYAPPGIPSSPA